MTPRRIALLLALATFLLFARSAVNGFVQLDDDGYIFNNPHVTPGLTWSGIQWAFTNYTFFFWQPLTWISHMVDITLFGLNPGPHHLENVLLHAINTALVFVLIQRFTGNVPASVLAALFFGWHPLRVESVVWGAERKDLLSALFWLLTFLSYERYVRLGSKKHLHLAMGAMLLGILSKPMVVTLPLVLLLVDYWPLRRKESWLQLIVEKIPFFAMAAFSAGLTYISQQYYEANVMASGLDLSTRLSNAVLAYTRYLTKIVFPRGLIVLYPYQVDLPVASVIVSLIVTGGVTFYCWRQRERRPYIWMGWLWFVITLIPTLGIVQSGSQSMADRFTYIPMIGLAMAVMVALSETALAKVMGVVILIYAGLTFHQIGYWKSSETLFTHTLSQSPNNPLIHYAFGHSLMLEARVKEAIPHFEETVRLMPDYSKARTVLANAYQMVGRSEDAVAKATDALKQDPENGQAYLTIGMLRLQAGQRSEAKSMFQQALTKKLKPDQAAVAHNGLGTVLAQQSQPAEAEREFRAAIAANPSLLIAHRNMVTMLAEQGKLEEGIAHLAELSQQMPANAEIRQLLDTLRATAGK